MLDWQPHARPWPVKPAERQRRIAQAREIWNATVPGDGNLLETYLWSRLLMTAPPPALRLHRSFRHRESGERRPAMIARVDHVEHGFVAVHATYLAIDGSQKATLDPVRKSFGPIGGGAVRLGQARADQWLAVGEGIETTLAVMIATELPGWAALSAGGIERLHLPPEARQVLICADNDADGRGEAAARNAAERWLSEGREVRLALPPETGSNFNDVLLREGI
jgi:putative DNA primase/helicase